MNNVQELEKLNENLKSCTKCSGLVQNRRNVVIYRGNPSAKIMLIGQNPGEQEDLQGIPFVGRSGKYLDKLLIKIGFDLEKDVYITNTVKCLTPNNREPSIRETINCRDYLENQIKIIDPSLIITMGKVAGNWMCVSKFISYFEMNDFHYGYPNWLPIYHPRYLITRKEDTYQAYKAIKKALKRVKENERI